MLVVEKVAALLTGISRRDIEALRPVQRSRFAHALRRIADIADPLPEPPRTFQQVFDAAARACEAIHEAELQGILRQLRDGERAEDSEETRCHRPGARGLDAGHRVGYPRA